MKVLNSKYLMCINITNKNAYKISIDWTGERRNKGLYNLHHVHWSETSQVIAPYGQRSCLICLNVLGQLYQIGKVTEHQAGKTYEQMDLTSQYELALAHPWEICGKLGIRILT